jgi:hypothetical protein
LKAFRFRGLFTVLNLAGNFARVSVVEAARGKPQRKIGDGPMTQL